MLLFVMENRGVGFFNGKKGQGLSTNAIVLIVLGVIILVILIAGFTIGWKTLFPFLNQNNVDTIKNACLTACSTNAEYDFCSVKRELNSDSGSFKDVTCKFLAKDPSVGLYGVDDCSAISCDSVVFSQGDCAPGKVWQNLDGNTLKHTDCNEVLEG